MRDFIASLIRKGGYELHRAGRYPLGRSSFRDVAYVLGNPHALASSTSART